MAWWQSGGKPAGSLIMAGSRKLLERAARSREWVQEVRVAAWGEMGQVRVCWGRENPLGLSGILSVDRESERYMEGRSGGKRIQE